MLGVFQRVFLLQVEIAVMHAVQDHVHARKVVGGAVHFLSEELGHVCLLGHAQQQGARPTSRVIDGFQPCLTSGHDAGKDGGDLLRGVKLARLLARATGKLSDQVFIGVAKNIAIGLIQLEIDFVQMR